MSSFLRRALLLLGVLLATAGPVLADADLRVVKTDAVDPIPPGGTQTYDILLANAGPDEAQFVGLTDDLPVGTTFLSLATSPGWTCTTPAVGSGGTIDCSIDSLAASDAAAFTIEVLFDAGLADGTVVTNTATASAETPEASPGDESGSAETTVSVAAVGADLSMAKTGSPDPVAPGGDLTYTLTVNNQGPSPAVTATFEDTLPDGTTFQSLSSPGGWICSTPAVGATGIVSCSIPGLDPGSAVFTLVVQVDASVPAGTVLANTVVVFSATPDPNPEDQNAAAFNTVGSAGDVLSLTITDNPDPVTAGFDVTYTILVSSSLVDAPSPTLTAPVPPGTTFQAFSAPPGWTCATPAVGATGTVSCTAAVLPFGNTFFSLTVRVPASASAGSTITDTASIVINPGGNSATATDSESTTVAAPTVVTASKAVFGDLQPNGSIVYTLVLSNAGPGSQGDNPGDELTDVLPSSLILVSASATSGTAVATVATNTVTWNGAIAAGSSVTITIQATIRPDVAFGTPVANQATFAFDATGDGTNESSGVSDDPSTAAPGDPTVFLVSPAIAVLDIPALDTLGLALLAALLALGGFLVLRRVL